MKKTKNKQKAIKSLLRLFVYFCLKHLFSLKSSYMEKYMDKFVLLPKKRYNRVYIYNENEG